MAKLRVRARAVDMLGRQQINGIPTAIHELFKNAHDAYAERVEVDYFRRTKVFILRDDGYGMTKDDVEKRWLTLGTESRLGANRTDTLDTWTGPKNLPRRTIMGEKGIGRLAIAVIAPITLLLTRAARPDGLHKLVVALVHWGLFEQPGIDISSIDVPIFELNGGALPTREDIHKLIQLVRENIEELADEITEEALERLNTELDRAKRIAPDKLDATLRQYTSNDEESLSLTGNGYGTHFILFPTAPELDDDIDGGADKEASALERNLLGFSNTMTGEPPVILTRFRDHHLDEEPEELIGPRNFFMPEEYEKADHHFTGSFDEYGQFSGTVRIYGKNKPFVCNWIEGRGRQTKCGPFSIDFAYIMGLLRDTQLAPDDFKQMSDKLDRIGGLYIYRDDIRILPYGNSDIDFLDIERRRTKSAQDWFFSYRRVFGYVSIDHENNAALSEKAGREGFRQNQAYRDFRAVLINLFQRLAFEFFRENAPQSDTFWEHKNALKAEAKLLTKQKIKADERRAEFGKLIQHFFANYDQGNFDRRAEEIADYAETKLQSLLSLDDDGELAIGIRDLETGIWKRISELEAEISIIKPRGLSLTKRLEKDWAAYQRISVQIRSDLIAPLRHEIENSIRNATASRIDDAQRRTMALQLVDLQKNRLVKDITSLRSEAYSAADETQKVLKEVIREEFANFREAVEILVINFTRDTASNPAKLEDAKLAIERELSLIRERETSLLDAIRRQMKELAESLQERETIDDRTGALEQRAQKLEEQLEFYSDFAQVGMGVGILQHEFENTARNMRLAIRDLKPWADGTPDLKKVYQRLRNSFDHLDGYLKMLDPLGRRLNRKKVELSGDEIRIHLRRIFRRRLEENEIELAPSSAFLSKTVKCHSAGILGAFVNLVDNAIYWVANGARGEKVIRLDADENGFLISNSGPGIEERLRERIFDFGETTKPGGRGMGLAVSREALRKEGFALELIRAGSDVAPLFQIKTNIQGGEGADGDE